MAKFLRLINGIPTTVEVSSSGATTYQASYLVVTPLVINDTVTLPNGETYNGTIDELVVKRNGVEWTEGIEYQYQNTTSATYITVLQDVPVDSRINFYKVS